MTERTTYTGPYKRTGIFRPKITGTLRPCVLPLIGKSFEWDFAGVQDDDASYPGQSTWTMARQHDAELTREQIGWWVPAEDIEFAC